MYKMDMFDVANMLVEVKTMPHGVERAKLEMLAYKTYVAICGQEGLIINPRLRYEHCQEELAVMAQWEDNPDV